MYAIDNEQVSESESQTAPALSCTLERKELLGALRALKAVVPTARRAALPVCGYAHVALDPAAGTVTLSATDLVHAIHVTLDAEVSGAGALVLDARAALELLRGASGSTVTISETGDAWMQRLRCGALDAILPGLDPAEFPVLPQLDPPAVYSEVSRADLAHIARHVANHAATDDARPIFQGVLSTWQWDKLTAVAADGFRLALADYGMSAEYNAPTCGVSALIPAAAYVLADKVMPKTGPVYVSAAPRGNGRNYGAVEFQSGHVRLYSRVIAGDYVRYAQIFPTNQPLCVRVDTAELRRALAALAPAAKDTAGQPLTLQRQGGMLSLRAIGPDGAAASMGLSVCEDSELDARRLPPGVGSGDVSRTPLSAAHPKETDADPTAWPAPIAISAPYLAAAAAGIGDAVTLIRCAGPTMPLSMRGAGAESDTPYYLLMPLNLPR